MSSAVAAHFPALGASLPAPFPQPRREGLLQLPRGVVPGSRLEVRPAPATVPSGIAEIDALAGGLPRGTLTEIFGPASSGRTALLLSALAAATRRQEVCALVDAGDSLHPESAAAAGIDLQRLLWIRCGSYSPQRHRGTEEIDDLRIDDCRLNNHKLTSSPRIHTDAHGFNHQSSIFNHQSSRTSKLATRNFSARWPLATDHCFWDSRLTQVLKATDLLLQSSGFGMVVVDLADVPPRFARRIALASWFRFRRAVENTPTVLLVMEQEPYAGTCASLALKMQPSAISNQHSADEGSRFQRKDLNLINQTYCTPNHAPAHAQLLRSLPAWAEIVHDRFQRKPVRSAAAQFQTRARWVNLRTG